MVIGPTSLMTTRIKGLQQNEGKTDIEMSHSDRKWNYRAHGKESVAACTQKQRQQKKPKDDRNMKGYKQVAICDCASSLSCCSAWP